MSAEVEGIQHPLCGLCGNPITSGKVGGGFALSGPGTTYHAVLDECGPPLPVEALPDTTFPPGVDFWPYNEDLRHP